MRDPARSGRRARSASGSGAARGGRCGVAAGACSAVEVGAISGLLGQRVLGQYEFPLLDARGARAAAVRARPNLAQAATALDADADELLRWVALHEVTHALQFAGVPWLRAAPRRRWCASCSATLECVDPERLLQHARRRRPASGSSDAVREGDLVYARRRARSARATLDRMQASMAVLEGHAEHVMDAVGAEVLPTCRSCAARSTAAGATARACSRLLEKLLGLDLKLRQYEQGKRFCDAVVARRRHRGAQPRLGRARALPTLAELDDPDAWLATTDAPSPPPEPRRPAGRCVLLRACRRFRASCGGCNSCQARRWFTNMCSLGTIPEST